MLPPLFPGGCCRHPGWASPSVVSLWGPSASLFSVTGLLGSLGFSRPLTCPPEPCRQVSAGLQPAAPQEQMRGRIPFPLSSQQTHSGPDASFSSQGPGPCFCKCSTDPPPAPGCPVCLPGQLHREQLPTSQGLFTRSQSFWRQRQCPRHAAPPQEAQLPGPQPQTPSSHRPWMCEGDFWEGYLGWSLFSKGRMAALGARNRQHPAWGPSHPLTSLGSPQRPWG